jgi:hypothetical protein
MNTKRLIAGLLVAGTLTVGTAGVASAAQVSNSSAAGKHAVTQTVRHRIRHGAVQVVLATTNTTAVELRSALASGETIGQFATDHGSSPQAVETALNNYFDKLINNAVAHHHLSQTRAAKLEARVPTAVDKIVNRVWPNA